MARNLKAVPHSIYEAGTMPFNVPIREPRIRTERVLLNTGRAFLALIFVLSGILKIYGWSATVGYMQSKGVPAASVLLFLATLIEIVGGLALAFGRNVRVAAGVLFLYLIPVTLIMHNFWAAEGAEAQNQMAHFLKNISIMGGLLGFYVWGNAYYPSSALPED